MRIVRMNIAFPEATWQRLRRLAESERRGGRTSVSAVVRAAVDRVIAETDSTTKANR